MELHKLLAMIWLPEARAAGCMVLDLAHLNHYMVHLRKIDDTLTPTSFTHEAVSKTFIRFIYVEFFAFMADCNL